MEADRDRRLAAVRTSGKISVRTHLNLELNHPMAALKPGGSDKTRPQPDGSVYVAAVPSRVLSGLNGHCFRRTESLPKDEFFQFARAKGYQVLPSHDIHSPDIHIKMLIWFSHSQGKGWIA